MTAPYEKLVALAKTVDPQGMIDLAAALPAHVEDGLKRGAKAAAAMQPAEFARIVVVGMGGSAIAGDLVRSYYGAGLERSIHVCRGCEISPAIARDAFFVFSSYSGDTEETLNAYDQLRQDGRRAIAITSGGALRERCERDGIAVCELPPGLPPRAALGYSFAILLQVASAAGAGEITDDPADVVESLHTLSNKLRSVDAGNQAAGLAQQLDGKYPIIYACNGLLGEVAVRWGTQLNENSKSLAHVGLFPEAAHNEICGWDGGSGVEGRAYVVSLEDEEDSPAASRRRDIVLEAIRPVVAGVSSVRSEGRGRMARLLTTVMIGDFTSVYLAYLYGVDPTPVERISALKSQLSRDS